MCKNIKNEGETSGMIQSKYIGNEIHIVSEKPEELFLCDPYKAAALKCVLEYERVRPR